MKSIVMPKLELESETETGLRQRRKLQICTIVVRQAVFGRTLVEGVRPMLSDRCPVLPCLSVCNVGVLWRNGWMDHDDTWHGGRQASVIAHC